MTKPTSEEFGDVADDKIRPLDGKMGWALIETHEPAWDRLVDVLYYPARQRIDPLSITGVRE